MIRRTGVTLIEVMASIFIMGIGLIAILTLFPFAGLTMAQAIKDGRAAQASANANALAQLFDNFLRHDNSQGTAANRTIYAAMYQGISAAQYDYPSNPVYVDPIGYQSMNANRAKLGGIIPRVLPSYFTGQTPANQYQTDVRLFTILDDIVFDQYGQPEEPTSIVQRQGLYSWAYMVQRPRLNDPSVVNLTVVVYKDRGLQLAGGGLLDQTEPVQPANGSQTGNTVSVSGTSVPLHRGDWILDASTSNATDRKRFGPTHAFFYRIVSVTSSGSSSTILETDTPLRANMTRMVIMQNVVEVFEKGPGWKP